MTPFQIFQHPLALGSLATCSILVPSMATNSTWTLTNFRQVPLTALALCPHRTPDFHPRTSLQKLRCNILSLLSTHEPAAWKCSAVTPLGQVLSQQNPGNPFSSLPLQMQCSKKVNLRPLRGWSHQSKPCSMSLVSWAFLHYPSPLLPRTVVPETTEAPKTSPQMLLSQ